MIIVRGTAHFAAGEIDRLRPQLNDYADTVRNREGCLGYCYAVDLGNTNCLHVIESWGDQAALDAYLADLGDLMNILGGAKMEVVSVKAYEAEFLKTVLGEE